MANGGWYGTQEEWQRIEAPLLEIDSVVECFSEEYGLELTKNHKDWPGRSMEWGESVRCIIQIYLADEKNLTWNVWLCASQDREKGMLWWKGQHRFWKQEMLVKSKPMSSFSNDLQALLCKGKDKLDHWHNNPEGLEFATQIQRL